MKGKGDVNVVKRVLRGRLYERRITADDLLTCPEVAAYTGWSLRWVYELLRRGKLKPLRRRGRRMIPATQLNGLRKGD